MLGPFALGVLRAGLVAVNVNPLYTAHELEHQLRDSGARAIVIYAGSANVLQEIVANTSVEHAVVTEVGDLLPPLRRITAWISFTLPIAPSQIASQNSRHARNE